jgi:hypothetical protein
MRRRRGPLAVLATIFMSLLAIGFSGSAAAGGPTSVLLVVPGEGRTASLYQNSPDYGELISLMGGYEVGAGSKTPPAGIADSAGSDPGMTVSWLSHDVNVWRVDHVYLQGKNGAWISTQTVSDTGELWSKPATWHQPTDAEALTALLNRLGVGPAGGSGVTNQAVDTQPAAAAPPASSTTPESSTTPNGWIWGPIGVLLGVVLTLAYRRWTTRDQAADLVAAEDTPALDHSPAHDDAAVDHALDDVAAVDYGPTVSDLDRKPRTETLSSHSVP